jgi:hypothetical protein
VKREKLVRLEGDTSLSSLIRDIGYKLIILANGSIKKATSRLRTYHKVAHMVVLITRHHGSAVAVKWLKACNLSLSKFLGGERLTSLRKLEPSTPLPRMATVGLPAIIGTRDRRSIASGSVRLIRTWMTLFSLYRIILVPGVAKLDTITARFSGDREFTDAVGLWMEQWAPAKLQRFYGSGLELRSTFSMDESASSSNKRSWLGMLTDVALLRGNKSLLSSFLLIMEKTCTEDLNKFFKKLLRSVPEVSDPRFFALPMKDSLRSCLLKKEWVDIGLGQLQQKEEAAGKVRTFAMVDSWTQTVLSPLHVYLSEILKRIPNDGTDSHDKAFERVQVRSKKYGCSYGYDLSAATDRLPISLQVSLLGGIFGRDFAESWANLLIGRPYYLIKTEKDKTFNVESFKYEVGQPMGARSSFVMLGLTHHMLVQYASSMLVPSGYRPVWDERYEIVGDDIVIFNKDLAGAYVSVMEAIGVPINVSKSVISPNKPVAEFVKRTCLNGQDVSAFSWKQFISQSSFMGRVSTVLGIVKKEPSFSSKIISVWNTVMKKSLRDIQPQRDVQGKLILYITYALKSGMKMRDLFFSLLLLLPKVQDGKLVFDALDLHDLDRKIKAMSETGEPSKILKSHPAFVSNEWKKYNVQFIDFMKKASDYYWIKVRSLNKKWDDKQVLDAYSKISDCMKGQYTSDLHISCVDAEGNDLILDQVIHDWLKYNQFFYHVFRGKELMAPQYLVLLKENRYIKDLDSLSANYATLQVMASQVTKLEIWKRIEDKKVEKLDHIVENSLLKDFVEILEIQSKPKSTRRRGARV